MARKVLGQSAPAADTDTDVYTVPADHESVVSTVLVCNRDDAPGEFYVAVRPAGAALDDEHWQYHHIPILGPDTFAATLGITLAATDVVTVKSNNGMMSFSVYGSEVSTA